MNLVVAMKQIPDLQQIRFSNRRPVLRMFPSLSAILTKMLWKQLC